MRARPFPATWLEWLIVAVMALGPVLCQELFLARAREHLRSEDVWVGFTQADQPFYYAEGRELFDRGNGLVGANPYDLRPEAPRIYTHLFAVAAGWTGRLTGIGPPRLDLVLRLVLSPALLVLGVALVGRYVRLRPLAWPMAFATIWGAGLGWAMGLVMALQIRLLSGMPPRDGWDFLYLWGTQWGDAMAGHGGWGTSLGRQVGSAPECLYHLLALGAVMALVRGRWWWSVLWMALVCWAHPFTGLIVGLTVAACLAGECLVSPRRPWAALAASAAVFALFLWYNGVFLDRDPAHREVAAAIRDFSSSLWWRWILPAYGLWALLPWLGLVKRRPAMRLRHRPGRVLAIWTLVCLALVFNDRWLPLLGTAPVTPLHFSRGHLFVALVIWSASGLVALASRRRWSPVRLAAVGWAVALLSVPDTPWVLSMLDVGQITMRREEASIVDFLSRVEPGRRVAVIGTATTGSGDRWLPVLTSHTGVGGHLFNTPRRDERVGILMAFTAGRAEWQALASLGVEAIVVPRAEAGPWRARLAGWRVSSLGESASWEMWLVESVASQASRER